jgi:hypothetical protein
MDARYIKVNCTIPGLENLAGCGDLCSVLQELGRLIVENGGNGSALTVALAAIDRNAPLGSTVSTSAACGPLTEYRWTIENLANNQTVTFAGAPLADASPSPYVVSGSYSLPLIDWNAVGGQLCNYRVALTVTDSCNRFATDVKTTLLPAGTLFRQAFAYTGSDQVITVPTCATRMRAKCWGGGGHAQSYLLSHTGGAGGYTEAVIPVTPGETLRVMVGEGGDLVSSYGFAGTTNHGVGGGLSGIFRKPINNGILASDSGYALIVAGGGGGADYGGTAQSRGGNGNDPVYSGTQNSMQGISDNTEGNSSYNGGGGGGYRGGGKHYRNSVLGQAATLPYGGEGGSGFAIAGATNVVMLATPDGQRTAPNNADPDYQPGIGVGGPGAMVDGDGGNGLVVVYWMTG